MKSNYYQILGISNEATNEEITTAFRLRMEECLTIGNLTQMRELITAFETLSDPTKKEKYDEDQDSPQIECSFCGTKQNIGNCFCVECGGELSEDPLPQINLWAPITNDTENGQDREEKIMFCPGCGAKHTAYVRFCVYCGMPLESISDTIASPKQDLMVQRPVKSPPSNKKVERYGRVEYFSPMDKGYEYSLRVGFLLDQSILDVIENAKVRLELLKVLVNEDEPIVRITPHSGYINISPPYRDLKIIKEKEVFTQFMLNPWQLPGKNNGKCSIHLDFEYKGEVFHTIDLPVQIQEPYWLGNLRISHQAISRIAQFGSVAAIFDLSASIFSFMTTPNSIIAPIKFTLGFILVVGLLTISVLLKQKAGNWKLLILR